MQALATLALYCPFPSFVNPYAAEVHQGTLNWICRWQLAPDERAFERIRATRLSDLAARFHPNAPLDALQLISDWYIWMFIWDDLRDESVVGRNPRLLAARSARFLDILKGEPPASKEAGLAGAMWDLRERFCDMVGQGVWMRRFTRLVEEHFDATVWEATNRARNLSPDMASYLRMRPITGGMQVDAALIEVSEGFRLPPEIRSHATMMRLTQASNNAICWFNDMVSLQKERATGEVHNLVLILQRTHGLEMDEAMQRALAMHNDEVATYLEAGPALPPAGKTLDTHVQQYVGTLRARTRGHHEWALASARYLSPDFADLFRLESASP